MKKWKKTKKLLSLFLCAAMLSGLTACGNSDSQTKQSKPAEQEKTSESKESTKGTQSESSKADEVITLTVMGETGFDGVSTDNAVGQYIKDKLGIVFEFTDVTEDKLKVVAAGGDLPDIVEIKDSQNMLQNLIDSGALWAMDEWLESNGDNLKENLSDALKYSKEVVGGGKTYFLPVHIQEKNKDIPNLNGFVGFFTRWDYYKELGCPELHSEDDYLNVLKQMVDAHPETADGKKVYAFGAWIDWGLYPYNIFYPFSYGYTNLANNQLFNQVEDQIEDQFTVEDGIFWKSLAFFNKAYRMGIMDPESFTMKYEQYKAKIRNGELLVGGCSWHAPDLAVCGENAAMVTLPGVFPYASQIYPIEQSIGYMKTNALVISANCKYPEKAMELLDFLNSDEGMRLIYTGIQGEDWDYVDGVPQMIGTRLENFISNDTVQPGYASKAGNKKGSQGITLYTWLASRCDTNSAADGYPLNLTRCKEYNLASVTAGMKDFSEYYTDGKAQYPGDAYVWMVEQGMLNTVDKDSLAGSLMESLSDESARIASKADEYFQANIAKIITCEDDAAFQAQKQKMIDDVMAMGYQTVLDEVAEKFERAKNLADSF